MPRFNPIPQSQKNIARQVARRAWHDAACDPEKAIELIEDRMHRQVGAAWLVDATLIANDLIGHWHEKGISEPQSVYCRGEPGVEDWDES